MSKNRLSKNGIDAIVVGSGFAGAVTACRLTEAGWHICILERGRRYLPSDLPVLPDESPGRVPDEGAAQRPDRKIPDFTRAFWNLGQGLWDVRDLGELVVAQAAGYGGGSLIYANVHLRAPDAVFDRWPAEYRRGALEQYYDLAAYMLDVQAMPGPFTFPKTAQFERVAAALGRPAFRPPLAVNFGSEGENRFGVKQGRCDMGGQCCFGCPSRAKSTLDLNYLTLAERGGAEVRTLAEVVSISQLRGGGYEVTYRDHLARGRIESATARYVFLCAGAVNTTELLLRSKETGGLEVQGQGLGTRFYPNADDLAVVFDCDEVQEPDRGPTITSSLLYDDGKTWLLVQDGGMPTHLEPLLGVFRSPLWLHRNRFRKGSDTGRAVSQKPPYAELPFASLVDALSGLTGSAITPTQSLAHDVSQTFLAFARGGRELGRWKRHRRTRSRMWMLYPEALKSAMKDLRHRALYDVALAATPTLERLLRDAARKVAPAVAELLKKADGGIELPKNITSQDLAEWALTLGLQLIWGSQAGLVGAIAEQLEKGLLPQPEEILGRASDLLRWALDYRLGDGHTAVLLSMGPDSKPWRLELAGPMHPTLGSQIVGRTSGAAGTLVSRSAGVLVLAGVTGSFVKREALLTGGVAFGISKSTRRKKLRIASQAMPSAAASLELHALRIAPLPLRSNEQDSRRFRTDVYRTGQLPPERPAPPSRGAEALRAHPSQRAEPPEERTKQELLLRDIADKLGGELRTDPLRSFMDRRVTVHPQGGCPMAAGPDEGVTDAFGKVFGCDGLYVMDAAAFPTPVGVNPSATIAAVAEFKVAKFIRGILNQPNWRAEGSREAPDWAKDWAKDNRSELDPLRGIQRQKRLTHPPVHRPIGIEFTEVMKGTHTEWQGGKESTITTDLTVTIPDLASFLEQNRRGNRLNMDVRGKIRIAGVASIPDDRDLDVSATSRMRFSAGCDLSGAEWRAIEYWLEFEANGRGYVLDGIKDIKDDTGFDVWEDTTTLRFRLLARDHPGRPLRRGVLRLPAAEFFGRQLPSFKATNVDGDPARQVWALSSFARFFFGHLVDVYVPALDRVVDVARGIAGRGHV